MIAVPRNYHVTRWFPVRFSSLAKHFCLGVKIQRTLCDSYLLDLVYSSEHLGSDTPRSESRSAFTHRTARVYTLNWVFRHRGRRTTRCRLRTCLTLRVKLHLTHKSKLQVYSSIPKRREEMPLRLRPCVEGGHLSHVPKTETRKEARYTESRTHGRASAAASRPESSDYRGLIVFPFRHVGLYKRL